MVFSTVGNLSVVNSPGRRTSPFTGGSPPGKLTEHIKYFIMGKTFRSAKDGYLKAERRASRLIDIEQHGKSIAFRPSVLHKSDKAYSRKAKHKTSVYDYM